MKKSIVVVGSINIDLVARVERIPARGETILGQELQTLCGGKGANQAVAAARLGAPTTMIGKVGNDHFGRYLIENLIRVGVDSTHVETVPGSSGTALISATPAGENSIIVIPGANSHLLPEDLDQHKDELRSASMILAQLESPLETVEHLAALAESCGVPLVLDPAPARPLGDEILRAVTWFTPNETETCAFLRELGATEINARSAPAVAKDILQLGVRNVILKLGAKGVFIAGRDVAEQYIPGFSVEAVDSTGAGDAFNGAFAFAVAIERRNPREAAEYACAAAAVSVTRQGAQAAMAARAEVEEFLHQNASVRVASK